MRHPNVDNHGMLGCGMKFSLCGGLSGGFKRTTHGQCVHVFCTKVKIYDWMVFTSKECNKLIMQNRIVDFSLCVNDFVKRNIFSPLWHLHFLYEPVVFVGEYIQDGSNGVC